MDFISLEELKIKYDRGDDFKLVMTLNETNYKIGHIPGSINVARIEEAEGLVSPSDEIIIYCHDENCPASLVAYDLLINNGYSNVRRFAGGIAEWRDAGYPIEVASEFAIEEDQPLTLAIPVTNDEHIQGDITAPKTLLVYGDYQCPYTRRTMTHVKALQRELGAELCYVYRHFPAPEDIHPHAWIASEAALAANAQGKFWEMHTHLFSHQKALAYDELLVYAGELGLDVERFEHDMREHLHDPRIEHDRKGGFRSGVRTVPTLFINNVFYKGELTFAAALAALQAAE